MLYDFCPILFFFKHVRLCFENSKSCFIFCIFVENKTEYEKIVVYFIY